MRCRSVRPFGRSDSSPQPRWRSKRARLASSPLRPSMARPEGFEPPRGLETAVASPWGCIRLSSIWLGALDLGHSRGDTFGREAWHDAARRLMWLTVRYARDQSASLPRCATCAGDGSRWRRPSGESGDPGPAAATGCGGPGQQQRRAEEEERLRQQVEGRADELIALNKRGRRLLIYHSEYLPVDSVLNDETIGDEFDITVIRALGLDGWEVTAWSTHPWRGPYKRSRVDHGGDLGRWGRGKRPRRARAAQEGTRLHERATRGYPEGGTGLVPISHGLDSELVGGPHGEGGRELAVASTPA